MPRAPSAGLVQTIQDVDALDRSRLADVVHDQPLQLLAAAMLRLDMLRASAANLEPSVHAITDLLSETVSGLRLFMALLQSPDVDLGLGIALQRLTSAASLAWQREVTFAGAQSVDLDERSARAAHRIVVDAMMTTSPSACLAIELSQSVDDVRLALSTSPMPASLPPDLLARIAARVEATGGRLPDVVAGSTVAISWPLRTTRG